MICIFGSLSFFSFFIFEKNSFTLYGTRLLVSELEVAGSISVELRDDPLEILVILQGRE